MKRGIFGYVYDTDTATDAGLGLYQTPEGRFFIWTGGGMEHEVLTPLNGVNALRYLINSIRTAADLRVVKGITRRFFADPVIKESDDWWEGDPRFEEETL